MKSLLCISLLIAIHTSTIYAQDRLSGKSFATRSEVLARNGMVATNHPIATQIGVAILKQGGSAIDAAMAANAFLGFADPGMNGIGGDLFAIVWDARSRKLYGLNASGKSPAGMSYESLKKLVAAGNQYNYGPLSVTTPGCVDGWFELNKKFGKLTMSEILQPTIQYAREGVPITAETADNFLAMEPFVQKSENENFKAQYFTNGHFPRKGDIYKNPDLANTLEIIARKGRDGYYKGEVAEKIAAHVKAHGGFLSTDDLAHHASLWVDPVSVNYRGYDVWEMPPNGQGTAALEILSILKNFNIAEMGFGSAAHIHHYVEAKKMAYEDMAKYYGDPEYGNIPMAELLSDKYGAKRAAQMDPDLAKVYNPGLPSGDHTIYLTAADKDGNMISLIQSNSSLFGSMEVPKGLGFALQNRGSGFILTEGHINVYAPGKRPFHTIIPAFITKDGAPFMSFGVMGGDMQPQGHVQILLNILDFGMNLQEAGDAPRIYHRGTFASSGHVDDVGETYLESGFPYESISLLMDKGHNIGMVKGKYGGYQAIMVKDHVYYGASESRKDGQAAGY